MSASTHALFADITARLEDLHAVAVEGMERGNSQDMQQILTVQLRVGFVALGMALNKVRQNVGDADD